MSLYDYRYSRQIVADDPPFYALIMAAYRRADDENQHKLEVAWPQVCIELRARYDAPGGLLAGESEPA